MRDLTHFFHHSKISPHRISQSSHRTQFRYEINQIACLWIFIYNQWLILILKLCTIFGFVVIVERDWLIAVTSTTCTRLISPIGSCRIWSTSLFKCITRSFIEFNIVNLVCTFVVFGHNCLSNQFVSNLLFWISSASVLSFIYKFQYSIFPEHLMHDVNVDHYPSLDYIDSSWKSWPNLYSMICKVMRLFWIEKVPSNLFELYFSQHRVKKHLIKYHHVGIVFLDTLHPGDIYFVVLLIVFGIEYWQLLHILPWV